MNFGTYKLSSGTLILIIGLIFTLLKVVIIDIDPPQWDIANLQPADELYYVVAAYNLFETGTLFNGDNISVFGNPWLSNLVTYLSLNIFGDNYLGLRFSSIVFSLVSVFFFWKILKSITENRILYLISIIFLVVNYSFTLTNIFVVPTTARLATSMIALYLMQDHWKGKKNAFGRIFLFSVVVCTLWIFTYPTNAFTVLALGLVIGLQSIDFGGNKTLTSENLINLGKSFVFVFLGLLLAALIWVGFSFLLGEDPLNLSRGEHYAERVGLSLKQIVINVVKLFQANIFLFNPFFLFASLFSILNIGYIILKRRSFKSINKLVPIIIFLVSFLVQSIFINDFPQRKLIMLLPILLLIIVGSLDYFISHRKESIYNFKSFPLVLSIPFMVTLGVMVFSIFIRNLHYTLFSIGCTLVLMVYVAFLLYTKRFVEIRLWIPIFIVMVLMELFSTFSYSFNPISKNYENVNSQLLEYNDANFIGGWSMGFRNNNDIKPYLNRYLYYGNLEKFWSKTDSIASSNDKIDYSIGYKEDSTNYREIGFEPVKVIMKSRESMFIKDWILYEEQEK